MIYRGAPVELLPAPVDLWLPVYHARPGEQLFSCPHPAFRCHSRWKRRAGWRARDAAPARTPDGEK